MARAATVTKLPLDRWARIVGVNPLHFNGSYRGSAQTVCSDPWMQFGWQSSRSVSREEVARAILLAEQNIERYLGYHLLPTWDVDEWTPTLGRPKPELFRLGNQNLRGFAQGVEPKWGHIISGGIMSKAVVTAGAAITYSDEDGDGFDETATISFTSSLPICELRVYLPGRSGEDEYEIRPVKASVSGATVTIVFERAQCVKPSLQDALTVSDDDGWRGVDAENDDNFETTVDVYRVYNDPQLQARLLWEPFALGCSSCTGDGCASCSYSTQTACLTLQGSPRAPLLAYHPAVWNAVTLEFDTVPMALNREPELVRLYYYSGLQNKSLPCPRVELRDDWAQAIAYYALTLLEKELCSCGTVKGLRDQWRLDYAMTQPDGGTISAPGDVDNPFGSTRGAINAWRLVKQEFVGGAVIA